jgi:hydrogenase expression/formation protein HypC
MCVGIPMLVVSSEPGAAWCEGRGDRQRLDTSLVGELAPGTWVLAFRGTAREVMSAEDAARTDAALDALEAVLRGESSLDRFFPDLVDREPQLPDHLREPDR